MIYLLLWQYTPRGVPIFHAIAITGTLQRVATTIAYAKLTLHCACCLHPTLSAASLLAARPPRSGCADCTIATTLPLNILLGVLEQASGDPTAMALSVARAFGDIPLKEPDMVVRC